MDKISHNEYSMLYGEMMENLKKQDNNISIIISILGLSNVFTTIVENIAFMFLILFITLIIIYFIAKIFNLILVIYHAYKLYSNLRQSYINFYTLPNYRSMHHFRIKILSIYHHALRLWCNWIHQFLVTLISTKSLTNT